MAAGTELVLGIDLGTTFTSAAVWAEGRIHYVKDERGEALIPSVVHFPASGPPIVGAQADLLRLRDPTNTVGAVKRLLGRSFDSPEVRVVGAHTAFKMKKAANGSVIVTAHGRDYTPSDIAALILERLKARAELAFGQRIRRAVFTQPVTAGGDFQAALSFAARRAGLEVFRFVQEPIAGALAHRLYHFSGQRKLLVYDFGGGTFDVTILEQTNRSFRPLAAGGDGFLGGENFDHALAKLVAGHVFRGFRADITKDSVRWDQVVRHTERVKRALSADASARLHVPEAFTALGQRHDLDLTINRADAEGVWKELVDASARSTADAMLRAGVRPSDLAMVLMVGGTTHVPLVRRTVRRIFGTTHDEGVDPQTAVATGAALLATEMLQLAA